MDEVESLTFIPTKFLPNLWHWMSLEVSEWS